jgi:hypothetical protein
VHHLSEPPARTMILSQFEVRAVTESGLDVFPAQVLQMTAGSNVGSASSRPSCPPCRPAAEPRDPRGENLLGTLVEAFQDHRRVPEAAVDAVRTGYEGAPSGSLGFLLFCSWG